MTTRSSQKISCNWQTRFFPGRENQLAVGYPDGLYVCTSRWGDGWFVFNEFRRTRIDEKKKVVRPSSGLLLRKKKKKNPMEQPKRCTHTFIQKPSQLYSSSQFLKGAKPRALQHLENLPTDDLVHLYGTTHTFMYEEYRVICPSSTSTPRYRCSHAHQSVHFLI